MHKNWMRFIMYYTSRWWGTNCQWIDVVMTYDFAMRNPFCPRASSLARCARTRTRPDARTHAWDGRCWWDACTHGMHAWVGQDGHMGSTHGQTRTMLPARSTHGRTARMQACDATRLRPVSPQALTSRSRAPQPARCLSAAPPGRLLRCWPVYGFPKNRHEKLIVWGI